MSRAHTTVRMRIAGECVTHQDRVRVRVVEIAPGFVGNCDALEYFSAFEHERPIRVHRGELAVAYNVSLLPRPGDGQSWRVTPRMMGQIQWQLGHVTSVRGSRPTAHLVLVDAFHQGPHQALSLIHI